MEEEFDDEEEEDEGKLILQKTLEKRVIRIGNRVE